MALISYKTVLLGMLMVCTVNVADAFGDRVVLKDGTVEETDRVWESEKYVHFILKGTQSVEIRYAKEIVERIERDSGAQPNAGRPAGLEQKDGPPTLKTGAPVSRPEAPAVKTPNVDRRIIEAYRNISFYDPQRPERYWAGSQSRHATLNAALEALSRQYHRPIDWVVAHMGEENDLSRIHTNLIAALDTQYNSDGGQPATISPSRVLQHDPEPSSPAPPRPSMAGGIQFYDPRRPSKYWTGPSTHHNTLQEAVNALADAYGVSPSWIEQHMGDTNELSEIHDNIRRNLQKGPQD